MAVTASRSHDASDDASDGDPMAALQRRVRTLETERDELARAARDAREAQRAAEDALRGRDEILGIVAHDLRNPLGTIVMGATALDQFAGAAGASAPRIRNIAERIQRQAGRMTRQLSNLTDLVEIQAGRLTVERASHAPATILAAAAELIAPLAQERGIAFEARPATELPALECDAERVVQALANLSGNAVKATPNGGRVEIGARRGERGSVLELFVRDSGPGLDGDEQAAMFDPAWRSKQPGYKAAGIGFAIARGIILAHGGRVWVDSATGSGTTVSFSLSPVGAGGSGD